MCFRVGRVAKCFLPFFPCEFVSTSSSIRFVCFRVWAERFRFVCIRVGESWSAFASCEFVSVLAKNEKVNALSKFRVNSCGCCVV